MNHHPHLFRVKQEITEPSANNNTTNNGNGNGNGNGRGALSRVSNDDNDVVLPDGFLDPLPRKEKEKGGDDGDGDGDGDGEDESSGVNVVVGEEGEEGGLKRCRNFWKAGDFDEEEGGADWETLPGGMDHVRVHPRFLHSNATSHKWVLGAFAELLDNSLDEYRNGATYVNIDMLRNKKDGNRMLVIEDNGGGMDPDKMRQCMSLGYSVKSKVEDTIGQYGNGFKTSSMRLGADVIVFSRCSPKDGKRPTQSIGLLSYTFLRSTGKEDIVVPMIDYKKNGGEWKKIIRSSTDDWNKNVEAVVQWSPFSSEADLLKQFDRMKDQGTLIVIYNLWEDDQGQLELDFDADEEDIQIRGVNRDEKNINMAKNYPNSKHFLLYRHSLRIYASILYLRLPPGFRMILRGKDIQHHNIVNDMMMTTENTYRPQPGGDNKIYKDSNIVAVVTMGFVKDAKAHIDVQGYNVYHKNRLIKPFWRLWNSTGSDGRGVIGVLEANFVEPAHDKQGFERTIVLSRLEARLIQMQKTYWRTYCHKIGYAPRVNKNSLDDRESSLDYSREASTKRRKAASIPSVPLSKKYPSNKHQKLSSVNGIGEMGNISQWKSGEGPMAEQDFSLNRNSMQIVMHNQSTFPSVVEYESSTDFDQLMEENRQLKMKLGRTDEDILGDLLRELERERNRCKGLKSQLEEVKEKYDNLSKEQESIIDIFSEERDKQATEEDALRKKLKEATSTIEDLVQRVKQLELEKMKNPKWSTS